MDLSVLSSEEDMALPAARKIRIITAVLRIILKPLSISMMNISQDSTDSGGLIFSRLFIGIWIAAICTTALPTLKSSTYKWRQ